MPTELRKKTNRWIRQTIGGLHFGIVLNLGCGSDSDKEGSTYSQYFTYDKLIKIDNNPKYKVNHIANAENMPIDSNSIDFLFMNWVIYKTDMLRTIQEMKRVLKKEAKALISYADPSKNRVDEIRRALEEAFIPISAFTLDYCFKEIERRAEVIYGKLKD